MLTRSLAAFMVLALPVPLWADDAGVALHVQPSVDAPVLATVSQEALALLPSNRVQDPTLAQEGWREVLYGGGVAGFVELGELRGDSLAKGAPVHFDPDLESPIVTTFEQGDTVEIRSRGPWSAVFIKKPLPLYTQATGDIYDVAPISVPESVKTVRGAPAAETPATEVRSPVAETAPTEENEPSPQVEEAQVDVVTASSSTADNADAPITGPVLGPVVREQDTPAAPVQPEPVQPQVDVAPVSQPVTEPVPERLTFVPSSIPGQGAVVIDPNPVESPNFFEGRLQRTRSFLFWRHPFDFQLVGPDGKRLWYLDDSQMLQAEPLVTYLGEMVVVHGRVEKANNRGDLVIRAEHLR